MPKSYYHAARSFGLLPKRVFNPKRRIRPASACAAAALILSAPSVFAQTSSELDEIITTGSPLTRSVNEAITGLSVLTGDELSDRLAGTIGETLKSEPGVSSTQFGAGASRPIIRGQDGDRVRVLTNGIGSIDASSSSPDHAVAVEPAQAKRIEVVRGAALLRYGSSGSGGIVNVIDGRIPDSHPENGRDIALRIGASTVDLGQEVAASINQSIGENFVFHADGTLRNANDYRLPDTSNPELNGQPLANSFVETNSLTGGLSYIGERGFIGIAVQNYNTFYGIPGDPDEAVTIDIDQLRLDVNAALELDGFIERVQFFGGIADFDQTEFEAPGEPGTVFTNNGFEARLEAIQTERGAWKAAHGVQVRRRDFSAVGEEAFVPPTVTTQFGAYSFHEVEFGDIHLEGSARYERTDQDDSTGDDDRVFNLFSASIGGDIHITESLRFGGTAYRTERAPTTEELFSGGPHLATGQFEIGDAALDKETALGGELALRYRKGGYFLTLNGFYIDYDDYVFQVETGEIEDDLPVFLFTGEDARFRGFEAQTGLELGTYNGVSFKTDALAEFVRAQTDSGNLPRIPPLSILAGLDAETEHLSFRAEIDYNAAQNNTADFETRTDDFTLVNLFATWKGEAAGQKLRFSVSASNLFDVEARQATSFLKDEVPLPGRNFKFSLSAAF